MNESVVEIALLGRFEVSIDGVAVVADAWRRRHAAALVKLLALVPDRRLHREQVLDSLWPDVDPADAAPRLHKAAHFVRRATGRTDAIVVAGEVVALFPDARVVVDAATFERLAAVDPVAAVAVYGGDLLPTDPYEPWLERDRDRLRLLRLRLLREAGRWEELLTVDLADEEAHVALMRGHLSAGRPTAVLRLYERLRLALRDELGVEPGHEARSLCDDALVRVATPVRSHRTRRAIRHQRCRASA